MGVAGAALLSYALFGPLATRETRNQPPRATLVATEPNPLPPEPRLQANPVEDLRESRASARRALDGYAWVDRKAGRVRIPIERAMDLVAERGVAPLEAMPVTPPATPAKPAEGKK